MGKDVMNSEQTEKLLPPNTLPLLDNMTADNLHMLPDAQYWARPVNSPEEVDANKTVKKPAVSLQLKKTPSPSTHTPSSAFSGEFYFL